ncbi:MAG: restriction endonuclease subunit S, partial [Eubacterium sp.]|nr:restriction endonuclease subunit S [Eubacterium sp.]
MKSEWKEFRISDCCKIEKAIITPKKDDIYNCFSLPAFDNDRNPEILRGYEIKSNKFILTEDTILFNKLNPKFKRVWNIHSLESLKNTICSTEFLPLKVFENINQDFLYYYISSSWFTQLMDGIKTGTSNSQQRIDWKLFLSQPIMLPSLKIQKKISSILALLDDKIAVNTTINNNLPYEFAVFLYFDIRY